MVSEQSNNETLENNLGETQIETEPVAAVDAAGIAAAAAMEKLLQNLQKPPIYPTGVVPQPYAPSSDQKTIHVPLVSGAWAHAPPPFHVTAHPVPFYAPSMSNRQTLPAIRILTRRLRAPNSNPQPKQQLYVHSLQQPLFSGNGIDQPQNRSDIEAGESSTHSKPTELSMYSKNPVTSFPNSKSNYITGSLGSSTGNFSGEKLNGQNYFSCSQSIKMFLEGRYQFGFLTGETIRPPLGDALERLWKGEDSLIRSMLINSMEPQIGKPLLYAATAKVLWDTTQTLYSKRQNASRLYTLRKQLKGSVFPYHVTHGLSTVTHGLLVWKSLPRSSVRNLAPTVRLKEKRILMIFNRQPRPSDDDPLKSDNDPLLSDDAHANSDPRRFNT
uniref:UBN2_3 domain-containing protein n=1 Tax=Cucumis melo TaxID=3656 RepID=A0A9I9E6Y4_CUCME